jgi:hypothetical protein
MLRGMSRRHLMIKVLATGAILPALSSLAKVAQAESLPALDAKDSAASALGFVADAAAASANPLYKKGEHCASCLHWVGQPSDATAGCNIYAGHSVPANGWCTVWSQRPG